MKILPLGAELFHAGTMTDGQTDLKELVVAYRNFANAPKNESLSPSAGVKRAGEPSLVDSSNREV
jgi:hypothetical protein